MESAFTDAEKRFVLAEVIKVSHMDVGTLVDFVKCHDIAPNWIEMQLPSGRNMRQCLHAAELMFDMHLEPPTVPSLKRNFLEEISDHPSKRHALQSPIETQGYSASRSFGSYGVVQSQHQLQTQSQPQLQLHLQQAAPRPSLPHLQPQPSSQLVHIQPRPPLMVASPSTSTAAVASSTPTSGAPKRTPSSSRKPNPTGRKRGRPSKADRVAWARANPSQATGYAPITPAPARQSSPPQPKVAYSPSPVGASAYQVFSAAPSSDNGSRSMVDPPSTALEDQIYESVPRSIHTLASPGTSGLHERNDGHIEAEGEARSLRELRVETGQRPSSRKSGLAVLEPPTQHTAIVDRRSGSPFAASALGGAAGALMDHGRGECHPTVTNQA